MKIQIGQTWVSEDSPHENFKIYDGIIDTCVDAFEDESLPFDEQPETTKIFFWERINTEEFNNFVASKKGDDYKSSYPYAWAGESKKQYILNKIKKFNMKLN